MTFSITTLRHYNTAITSEEWVSLWWMSVCWVSWRLKCGHNICSRDFCSMTLLARMFFCTFDRIAIKIFFYDFHTNKITTEISTAVESLFKILWSLSLYEPASLLAEMSVISQCDHATHAYIGFLGQFDTNSIFLFVKCDQSKGKIVDTFAFKINHCKYASKEWKRFQTMRLLKDDIHLAYCNSLTFVDDLLNRFKLKVLTVTQILTPWSSEVGGTTLLTSVF
jgi:hypothetical protein